MLDDISIHLPSSRSASTMYLLHIKEVSRESQHLSPKVALWRQINILFVSLTYNDLLLATNVSLMLLVPFHLGWRSHIEDRTSNSNENIKNQTNLAQLRPEASPGNQLPSTFSKEKKRGVWRMRGAHSRILFMSDPGR